MAEGTKRWQRFLLFIIRNVEHRMQVIPRKDALRFGERLGKIAYAGAGKYRGIAHRNLQLTYGDAFTAEEREAIVRRVFIHFGKCAIDFLRGPLLKTKEDVNALFSRVEGWDEFVQPSIDEGRAIIFVAGHLGNFELQARYLALNGLTLTCIGREPEDQGFADWVRRLREASGYKLVKKGDSVRPLLAALKRGESLGMLADQNSGDVFVPFFGIPAGTVAGPAVFGMRTGAALIPVYCLREPDDSHRLIFYRPIETKFDNVSHDEAVARIMKEVNALLEQEVRRCPDQYLWLHNRWKSSFDKRNRQYWPEELDYDSLREIWQDKGKKSN